MAPSPSRRRAAAGPRAGLGAGLAALATLAAAGLAPAARAGTVGGPNVVRFHAAIVADMCSIQSVDGHLAALTDRTLISSDPAQLGGAFLGSPLPAKVTVTSNMGSQAVVVADQPQLTGPTAPSTEGVSLGGQDYALTSQLNTLADGSLSVPLNVRFTSSRFASGNYQATAVVTCTDNGTPSR